MQSSILRGLTAGVLANLLLVGCVGKADGEAPSGKAPDSKGASPATTSKPAVTPAKTAPGGAAGGAADGQTAAGNAAMPATAPAVFRVKFKTTAGDMVVECHKEWAPIGAERFFELVKKGFYEDIAFFRVIPNFMAQFGIHGDPEQSGEWRGMNLQDEPVKQSNTRGMMTYAKSNMPNSRTTQMFINFKDNSRLDGMGFAPFAKVVEGIEVLDKIFLIGERPAQDLIQSQGNAYLKKNFPELTYIRGAEYLGESK